MPWKIDSSSGQHCVVRADTGKQMKCYDNHGDALAYLKALYANATDVKKFEYEEIMKKAKDHLHVYKIVQGGGGYQVINADTGEVKGSHGSYEEALANLRALYVNVPGAAEDAKTFAARAKKYVEEVQKFNPYHDANGRFTSGGGGAAVRGAGAARAEAAKNLGDTSYSMDHHSDRYWKLKGRPDNLTKAVREVMTLHEKAYHAHGNATDAAGLKKAREASKAAHAAESKLPKV